MEAIRPDLKDRAARRPIVGAWVRAHGVELAVTVFAVGFALGLPFIDTGNLTRFLLAASYLAVGRNPYPIFPYPPPPGLFAVSVPAFAVYAATGGSLAAANFFLKLAGLAGLLASASLLRRLALFFGAPGPTARRLQLVLLTSGAVFYVTFVWVEQDLIGIALTLLALYVLLKEQRGPRRASIELAGFGLLGFAAFFYYFPIFLFPALLCYGAGARERWRRIAFAAVVLLAFEAFFLLVPGWDFITNSTGATGFGSPSPFSILVLLEPALFQPATPLQVYVSWVLLALLIAGEIAVPVLFARAGLPFLATVAIALTLPFLFLNLSNGDEFVWPLPFLLLALALLRPRSVRGPWLWLVEAYAAPMVVIASFFDSPGPGAGTGVFYLSYPQFHDAISIWTRVPDYVQVTQALALAMWLGLAGLVLLVDREAHRAGGVGVPTVSPPSPARARAPARWRARAVASARSPAGIGLIAVVVITLVAAATPTPALTASSATPFPIGYFANYPVANASLTYAYADAGSGVVIAPNWADPSVLIQPYSNISFDRNVAGETVSFSLALGVSAPAGRAYNTTVVALGRSDLNLLTPLTLPPPTQRLTPAAEVNVSARNVASPQFEGGATAGLGFSGDGYAQYDVGGWAASGGNLTVFFLWNGVQLKENLVAQIALDSVDYQVFGEGGVFVAGEKASTAPAWTFSAGQLVKPTSWNELSFSSTGGRVSVWLNGLLVALPSPAYNASAGAGLTLGDAGPYSDLFGQFAFEGTMVGPYLTAGAPGAPGTVQLCAFPTGWVPLPSCAGFVARLSGTYGEGLLQVTAGPTTFGLPSNTTYLAFGRLDSVGPQIALQFTDLSISTGNSLLRTAGTLDGAIGAPLLLGLWIWKPPPEAEARRPGGRA